MRLIPISVLLLGWFLLDTIAYRRQQYTCGSRIRKLGNISERRSLILADAVNVEVSTVVSRCTKLITESLNPVECVVTASDDDPNGSHIQIVCISDIFDGKSTLQRQRLIYKAIWDEMSGPVHAVDSIIAKTPKEMGL